MYLEAKGEWPPPAPVFHVEGNSTLRRFCRHIWLEAHAKFGVVVIIEGFPGLSKSMKLYVFGRLLDATFDIHRYVYDGEVFMETIKQKSPDGIPRVLGADEAIGTFLFSRNWARGEQKNAVQDIWKHPRHNKWILFMVAQNAKGLDWVVRDDVARWYIKLRQRNPVTNETLAELQHGVRVPIKAHSVGRWGYSSGDVTIFRPGGLFTIPAVSQDVVERYEEGRAIGVADAVE